MSRRVGRPARGEASVEPDAILDAALALLDAGGSEALTMRALGGALGVDPMTVHHHVGGRDALVAAVADRVYASVVAPRRAEPRARLAGLLRAYRAQVHAHPGLTLEIFRRRAAFPAQARRISDALLALLREMGLPAGRALVWRNLLVDYVHGAALAEAAGGHPHPGARAGSPRSDDPLRTLLAALDASEARRRR